MIRLRRPAATRTVPAGEVYAIPRPAFLWLLASVVAVLLPHMVRMPPWLTAASVACLAARVFIFQGRLPFPGSRLKTVMVFAMAAGVVAQFGRGVFSTDATVGVLLVGITLKMLEMRQRRDVLVVIYLCYFTVMAEFIYSQSIPVAFYMAVVVLMTTCALMALNQNPELHSPRRNVRLCLTVLAQSVPLMLACFLLFPRISPLWSVPLQTQAGVTGLSDNMSPGDIGNLTRSADTAFRVKFEGAVPPYQDLYWRAITMDTFNGRTWSRLFVNRERVQSLEPGALTTQPWFERIEFLGREVAYNVIVEPTQQNWLFTLQMPRMRGDRLIMREDYQVDITRRLTQRYSYDVRSFLDYRVEADSNRTTRLNGLTSLPGRGNSRARAFAEQLRQEAGDDPAAMVDLVLRHFREEEFFYTLSPAPLETDPVDTFLFETREGFCEHFASAFTFLMRAADVPARVVTGYMGGEFNPYDGTLTVRQYDAHAWSEVWLPGQGWVRVDPTAAVAPSRIEQGSDVTLQSQETFMQDEVFSLMRFRNSLLLNDLRLRLEMIDYAWNRFVLNYDQDMQLRLFSRLFGTINQAGILLAVGGFIVAMTALVAFFVLRGGRERDKPVATQTYLRFCRLLASHGMVRGRGETPLAFAERVGQAHPEWREDVIALSTLYTDMMFVDGRPDRARERDLARRVNRFRLA